MDPKRNGWFLKPAALLVVLLAIVFPVLANAQQAADAVQPETGTTGAARKAVASTNAMVVAAHPLAAKAGMDILARGGNAIDAMIAVQLVLGLVEPQSSGLGGGAFLVYHDAKTGMATTLDGRETAPMAATPDQFIGPDGEAMGFFDAVVGGLSVGTPGTVSLLETAHRKYGSLAWAELFEPAIRLAEDGFEVSPRLNESIAQSAESLFRFEPTARYFFSEEGVPIFAGTKITNKAYAETLRAIAEGGADAFYSGKIADDIVKTVQEAKGNPGRLSLEDLANYRTIERPPVCFYYRIYRICGMGPPSSGALTIGQILGMLESHGLAKLGPENPESWRLIGEASRLAFADRGRYMADSDFVNMPKGLLNKAYLKSRGELIPLQSDDVPVLPPEAVQPGEPPSDHALLFAPDQSLELPSTSHFSIVDRFGNVVSMTTTIENGFGSRLMTNGFLLNNELTDFSFVPQIGGFQVANRIEPGKRPRSSMAPTIVYKDGKPYLAIGSPGGSRIIGFVATALIGILDWNMDVQAAINLPHLVNRFGTYDLEEGTSAEALAPALAEMGYQVKAQNLNSGLHAIMIMEGGLLGGADPRREGVAMGN
jgi:gamma-glutamyltranspeptidase/glutathione hydrolase